MPIRFLFLLISLTLLLSSCTSALLQTRRENTETEQRLVDKNLELRALEQQNHYLLTEKDRLSADLQQKSMTLQELDTRLNELKIENSKIKATTLAEKKKKAKIQQSLNGYSDKINALNNDNALSVQEKKKKIDELKQQIRKYLMQ